MQPGFGEVSSKPGGGGLLPAQPLPLFSLGAPCQPGSALRAYATTTRSGHQPSRVRCLRLPTRTDRRSEEEMRPASRRSREMEPMGQVLLFLAAVNSVPWALYFLLREQAATGEAWALFAWLLPTVWSPTIVALLLTRWADGPTGVREALGRLRYSRDGIRWLAVAAAVPAAAAATAVGVARAAGAGAALTP